MPSFQPAAAQLTLLGFPVDPDGLPNTRVPPSGSLNIDSTIPGVVEALAQIFSDIIIPDDISLGAIGGPGFNTTIFASFSGLEERNINWTRPRQRWNIGYNVKTLVDLQTVVDIFYICHGRAFGFLMKDWSDYLSNGAPADPPIAVANSDQNIGTGDGIQTIFQITKTYTQASRTYIRKITRPKNTTLLVAINAISQTEGVNYTVDYDTGQITFVVAPGNGLSVTCGYEFYVPVRFDTDTLDKQIDTFWLGEVPTIPVIELLE